VLSIGGWKWIAYVLYVLITYFLAGAIVTITSLVSPNRFRTPILIRWYCGACLLLAIIYFVIVGFNFSLLQINNLIFLLFLVLVSSPKNLTAFLKDAGV
jgi:hypothetical protein